MQNIKLLARECLKKLYDGTYKFSPGHHSHPLQDVTIVDSISAFSIPWEGDMIGLYMITCMKLVYEEYHKKFGRIWRVALGNCWYDFSNYILEGGPDKITLEVVNSGKIPISTNSSDLDYMKKLITLPIKERCTKFLEDCSNYGYRYWYQR